MRSKSVPHRGLALALSLMAFLPGCGTVQQVDTAMRRVNVLDRVFLPPPPPPRPVVQPVPTVAAAVPPNLPKDPLPEPEPEPTVEPARAAPPDPAPQFAQRSAPDPALRTAALLRQNPWITQFLGELNTAQQGRVTRALARRGEGGPAAATWDPMGLAERVRLLFGDGT